MSTTGTSTHSRTITALFDTRDAANRAVDDLEAAGIPRQHLSVLDSGGTAAGGTAADGTAEPDGFWQSLKTLFLPEEDRHSYAEGVRRGGFLVSVEADEANYNRVLDILDRDGAANLDEREEAWRTEGWAAHQPPSATLPDFVNPVQAAMPGAPLGVEAGAVAESDDRRFGTRDTTQVRSRVRSYSVGSAPAATSFASSQIVEHMEVISSDGQRIGTVDHLDGPDRIKLAKSTSPDGQHHYVPFTWIDHVDQHVHLKKTLADIKAGE